MIAIVWDSKHVSVVIRTKNESSEYDVGNCKIYASKARLKNSIFHENKLFLPVVIETHVIGSKFSYKNGVYQVDGDIIKLGLEVDLDNNPWLEALIRLSDKIHVFLLNGEEPPRPKIEFWQAGGSLNRRGFRRPAVYKLEYAILKKWSFWQSSEFTKYQEKHNYTIWGARLESLIDAGFKERLTEQRLKKAYYFLFPPSRVKPVK